MTPDAIRRGLRRALLDGRYRWGSERMRVRRYGGGIRRLELFPPGAPRHLRRCARMSRGWPVIAPATAVPTGAVAAELTGAALSLAVAVAVVPLLAVLMVLTRASAGVRAGSALVVVVVRDLAADAEGSRWATVANIVRRLQDAEDDLDSGLIDAAAYARVCRECFVDVRALQSAPPP